MHTVYVVSFFPADDEGGIAGFDWFQYLETASMSFADRKDPWSVTRLLQVEVSASPEEDPGAVTAELDARIDELEMTLPAIKQDIPLITIPDRIPYGG